MHHLKAGVFRLAEKEENLLDDGRVIGHVSADEVTHVDEVEHPDQG